MSDRVVAGWFYPGPPCNPDLATLSRYNGLNQVCGEFLRVVRDGTVQVMLPDVYGNGAYSPSTIQAMRTIDQVYCTLSGRAESGVLELIESSTKTIDAINRVVDFCNSNDMALDINIEGLAILSKHQCQLLVRFLQTLTVAIHGIGQRVRVVTPAEGDFFHGNWRNSVLRDVECDYVVYMAYDYMYDYPSKGVTTLDYIAECIANSKSDLGTTWGDRFILGVPNYGYVATRTSPPRLLTKDELLSDKGANLAVFVRDSESLQLTSINGLHSTGPDDKYYFMTDSVALDAYANLALRLGCTRICVWHLFGGNDWFSDDVVRKLRPETAEHQLEQRVTALEDVLAKVAAALSTLTRE